MRKVVGAPLGKHIGTPGNTPEHPRVLFKGHGPIADTLWGSVALTPVAHSQKEQCGVKPG